MADQLIDSRPAEIPFGDLIAVRGYRGPQARSLLFVDLRGYRRHLGRWIVADRMYLRGRWTPLVRVRVRVPRAADGGTEM